MKIDVILPYKEIFSSTKASAVSLTVKNSIEFSEFKNDITVYGQHTNRPFYKKFVGLKSNKIIHFSNNLSLIKKYIKLTSLNKEKKIIEIHNRPYLFNYLSKKDNLNPIVLYFHNDPLTMKGSKTIKQRLNIIKKASGIVFVSEFIKNKFLTNIETKHNNIFVLPNGIKRDLKNLPKKQKKILFVGRLVKEKGVQLFVDAISEIINEFTEWEYIIIGTSKAGNEKLKTNFEKKVINDFLKLGKNAKYLGFVDNRKVKEIMNTSSILIVPSIWDDPFPLTALEGLASGQAVIASARGGLVEMLKDIGILINDINSKKLVQEMKKLMIDHKKLNDFQKKSWKDFIYQQEEVSKMQDKIRKTIFKNFFIK